MSRGLVLILNREHGTTRVELHQNMIFRVFLISGFPWSSLVGFKFCVKEFRTTSGRRSAYGFTRRLTLPRQSNTYYNIIFGLNNYTSILRAVRQRPPTCGVVWPRTGYSQRPFSNLSESIMLTLNRIYRSKRSHDSLVGMPHCPLRCT